MSENDSVEKEEPAPEVDDAWVPLPSKRRLRGGRRPSGQESQPEVPGDDR
ncbi:hypothetical protein [Actinocrispum wychmicini]|nr:hypothetical protein [Actinocrispum wychmicini]